MQQVYLLQKCGEPFFFIIWEYVGFEKGMPVHNLTYEQLVKEIMSVVLALTLPIIHMWYCMGKIIVLEAAAVNAKKQNP